MIGASFSQSFSAIASQAVRTSSPAIILDILCSCFVAADKVVVVIFASSSLGHPKQKRCTAFVLLPNLDKCGATQLSFCGDDRVDVMNKKMVNLAVVEEVQVTLDYPAKAGKIGKTMLQKSDNDQQVSLPAATQPIAVPWHLISFHRFSSLLFSSYVISFHLFSSHLVTFLKTRGQKNIHTMSLQNLYSSLGKQGAEEEDKRKTKKVTVRRVLGERDIPHKVEEARQFEAERMLVQVQESSKAEIADLNEREAPNDCQIAALLQKCSTNWKRMIKSGDVTVLKTLETYNAIDRIPVSLVNKHFTMTIDNIALQGVTALHIAAAEGNIEMIRLLLLHPSIDANAGDHEWIWTPLHTACNCDRVEAVKLLLRDKRVDLNKADKYGETPLSIACCEGRVKAVKLLLREAQLDVNKADKDSATIPSTTLHGSSFDGLTPLHTACKNGPYVELVKVLLLDERVDVCKTDRDDETPLHTACKYGQHVNLVKALLLDERVDVNKPDYFGRTPLSFACYNGHVELVKVLLLDERVDVNKPDNAGKTPLYYACSYSGRIEVVNVLLRDRRVDLNKAADNGWTALDAGYNEKIKTLLKAKGAIKGPREQQREVEVD
eukprot:scaffold2011_cov290-Ochromonas_danica.AAC.3